MWWVAVSYAASGLGAFPILLAGTEEQKRKYLPPIANGEKLTAFALTEAEAGSDISNVKTRAHFEGDHWILNGAKQFITICVIGVVAPVPKTQASIKMAVDTAQSQWGLIL